MGSQVKKTTSPREGGEWRVGRGNRRYCAALDCWLSLIRQDEMREVEDRDNEGTEHHDSLSTKISVKSLEQNSIISAMGYGQFNILGYGQCSYLRLVDEANKVHRAFVRGKNPE